ncbi:hypothetical protein MXD61_06840 [Frankia sp. AgPm24]|uniref:hypothetical protein n=1 Tax=Frankia sp. AgPm24 TaxID=631128 RepID=UPI0020107BD9|nr:hypothetical protein [Frankia sp. AgPm24]MCK9921607.1 hypothetical protein [Frankia sp. AgPm24]
MSLPPLVDLDGYTARVGEVDDPGEQGRITVRLGDASALVRQVAGLDWVADDGVTATTPDVVVPVVVAMVQRAVANPQGLTGETLGDHSWQMANASPDLYLTRAERVTVRRAAGRLSVGTVSLEGDLPAQPSEVCW